jgi:hypothetical protein
MDHCEPEFYFLFRSEARQRLDSLLAKSPDDSAFEIFVLRHNLAFHGDRDERKRAEEMLKHDFPEQDRSNLMTAYAGSLQMIRVSHRTAGSKVLRTLSPFTKSPHTEAREGYHRISEAVSRDPSNRILRHLRATAAAESAEHLYEMFDSARFDLEWLEARGDPSNSVGQFFLNLNWAKYHYKVAEVYRSEIHRVEARRRIDLAKDYACTSVYLETAYRWLARIEALDVSDNGDEPGAD